MVAVDCFYDGFGIWFAVFINRVGPGHIQQWPVPWVSRVFEAFAQAFAKFVEELQLRARVTGRCHCLVTPLNQTLCLGKRAGLFRVVGRGHEEDLDRKSTRLNSSHVSISYAVFCLKKKNLTNSDD